jgi:acyl-coenzyme A thioesterase PaaI-like protein
MSTKSLQETFSPEGICFGCGPKNGQGLRLRSFEASEGRLVASFVPQLHHQAFEGVVNGGIIGALLDCHCNWTAAFHLMKARGEQAPPCTVTADYAIVLKRPTPMEELSLEASVVSLEGNKAVVEGTLSAGGKMRASCRGTFVAVGVDHPAYHRW